MAVMRGWKRNWTVKGGDGCSNFRPRAGLDSRHAYQLRLISNKAYLGSRPVGL